MGINEELFAGRTLDHIGAKSVEAVIQRMNAKTHSFSAFPFLCMNGTMARELCVVFHEPTPPSNATFRGQMDNFKNIVCSHTKSGMFTADLTLEYFEKIADSVPERSVFVIDNWNGYKRSLESDILKIKISIFS